MAVIKRHLVNCEDVFVLSCIFFVVCAGNQIRITDREMTWFESYNECNLADPSEGRGLIGHRFRAWTGALYLNTPWIKHAGCYKHTSGYALVSKASLSNSPAECSYYCKTYPYFTLKGIWCNCGNSTEMVIKAKIDDCSEKCPGFNVISCGSMKNTFVDVYRHISGYYVPTGHKDQDLRCSVLKLQNTVITFSAVKCSSRYPSLCLQNETNVTVLPNYAQFELAREQCNLIQNETLDKNGISQLVEGKAYWTGIHRVPVIHWLQNESGSDICKAFTTKLNVKCIMVDRKAQDHVLYVPMSCSDRLPAICRGNKLNPTDKIKNDCRDDHEQQTMINSYSKVRPIPTGSTFQISSIGTHADRASQLMSSTSETITPQSTSKRQMIPNSSTEIALNTSKFENHVNRTSQSASTILDKTVPQNTTEIQTTKKTPTSKSLNLATVEQQADLTSSLMTSISDGQISKYTIKLKTFTDMSTNHKHSSTPTERHNPTVVVYIIQTGCAFLLSLFVITVAIVTVILHKRDKFNSKAQSNMDNITPPTERRETVKVSKGNRKNSQNENKYQLKLLVPEAMHKTCNVVMSQEEFSPNLQASGDINLNPVNSSNSKMHDAFSRVRQTLVKTGQDFRQSLHFNMTFPFRKHEEVAYCTTKIDHAAFTYDTPQT